jgi:hypothetical protein
MMRESAAWQTRQKGTSSRVNMMQSSSGRKYPRASYIAPSNAPTFPELWSVPRMRVTSVFSRVKSASHLGLRPALGADLLSLHLDGPAVGLELVLPPRGGEGRAGGEERLPLQLRRVLQRAHVGLPGLEPVRGREEGGVRGVVLVASPAKWCPNSWTKT